MGERMVGGLRGLFHCHVCDAKEERIADLKEQVFRLVKEKENERAEYKRAIDALLVNRNLPAIGQGTAESHIDPTRFFTMFEEEVNERVIDGNSGQ